MFVPEKKSSQDHLKVDNGPNTSQDRVKPYVCKAFGYFFGEWFRS